MAFALDKELDTGVVVNYFRISGITINRKDNTVVVYVDAFLNQTARQEGKAPVYSFTSTLDYAQLVADSSIITVSYTAVKSLSEFAGAVDV